MKKCQMHDSMKHDLSMLKWLIIVAVIGGNGTSQALAKIYGCPLWLDMFFWYAVPAIFVLFTIAAVNIMHRGNKSNERKE